MPDNSQDKTKTKNPSLQEQNPPISIATSLKICSVLGAILGAIICWLALTIASHIKNDEKATLQTNISIPAGRNVNDFVAPGSIRDEGHQIKITFMDEENISPIEAGKYWPISSISIGGLEKILNDYYSRGYEFYLNRDISLAINNRQKDGSNEKLAFFAGTIRKVEVFSDGKITKVIANPFRSLPYRNAQLNRANIDLWGNL